MAAPEVTTVPDDDDDWLYGDEKDKEKKPDVKELEKSIEASKQGEEATEAGQAGEANQPDKDGGSDNSDDDDDDDVQVTIGDIRTWTGGDATSRNLFKSGQPYQKPGTTTPAKPAAPAKGIDIEAVGTINGVPTYDFEISSLEEVPWRKPGADITDYFNYGFTEETWQAYCDKQKVMRQEAGSALTSGTLLSGGTHRSGLSSSSAYNFGMNKSSNHQKPLSSNINTISIVGGNSNNSNNTTITPIGVISTIGGSSTRRNAEKPAAIGSTNPAVSIPMNFNQPPPSLPNTNVPPPAILGVPLSFTGPPPNFDASYYPGAATNGAYGVPPPSFSTPYGEPLGPPPTQPAPAWESSYPDRDRDRYDSRRERERSPRRGEDDLEKLYNDRTYEYDRHRDRSRDRSRERGRDRSRDRDYDKDRDRDRESYRDRDRDRDRDRSRSRERGRDRESSYARDSSRTRDRDDKHKSSSSTSRSSRKHRERDDSDTESRSGGKRKKSKRKKDEKDGDTVDDDKSKD